MKQHPPAQAETEAESESASALIDAKIQELGDWRGEMLARLRALIKEADPEVVEEWKWRGTPVWSHNGLICTGETLMASESKPTKPNALTKSAQGECNRLAPTHVEPQRIPHCPAENQFVAV